MNKPKLPTSWCVDIKSESLHPRLGEFKEWINNIAFYGDDSFGFESAYYGQLSDRVIYFSDKPFGEQINLDHFFAAIDPKPFTIAQLSNGECAVENDGTLEELDKVLTKAFPKDTTSVIFNKTFQQNRFFEANDDREHWGWVAKSKRPTQSVKLFLKELEGKEDFVLPEKWCIKLTDNNFKELGSHYANSEGYHHDNGWWEIEKIEGHTEITFEQFKKYVLKEDKEDNKPEPITSIKVGDEFRCVEDASLGNQKPYFIAGQKYKSRQSGTIRDEFGEDVCVEINPFTNRHFIRHTPETKEVEVKDLDTPKITELQRMLRNNATDLLYNYEESCDLQHLHDCMWIIEKLIEKHTKN